METDCLNLRSNGSYSLKIKLKYIWLLSNFQTPCSSKLLKHLCQKELLQPYIIKLEASEGLLFMLCFVTLRIVESILKNPSIFNVPHVTYYKARHYTQRIKDKHNPKCICCKIIFLLFSHLKCLAVSLQSNLIRVSHNH